MHQHKASTPSISSTNDQSRAEPALKVTANRTARRQSRLRPHAFGAMLLAGCVLFAGCTSTKFKRVSSKDAPIPPTPINAELGTQPVATTLNSVIVYKGPGSWKKEAYWDEYAITLRNQSSRPVTVTSATLFDYAGVAREPGVNPWVLEKQSKRLSKQYADAGLSFVRYAGPVVVSVGASYTAANAAIMGGGSAGGAAASGVLVPVYLVTVVAINQSHKHSIEREFKKRRLVFPLVLQPGEERSGSLFFPMAPSPQGLEFAWADQAGESYSSGRMPLPMLNGLHVDTAKSRHSATPGHG